MNLERGSTWGKWDFHVHTPYSILNNQFGFVPDPMYENDEKEFDEYVKKLFSIAIEKEIVAIGITDYFSIDGYKRIREKYLNNQKKMEELFPDRNIRDDIYQIYVFPNIELRLDTYVGNNEHSVNYHVFFSGDVDCELIEERFLKQVLFVHNRGTSLPISRNSIEQIGKEFKQNNVYETRNDYLVGMEKASVHHTVIFEALNKCEDFSDKFLLSITVDEDLGKISWKGRESETRRILYQQCHFYLSANENTRLFALAEGNEEERIREFGSIKPCVWGSDAHSYDKLFSPEHERYCWIKANPSFEGLKQVIYEPAERVKIQKDKPKEIDEHYLIDSIEFHDNRFDNKPIYFGEGLTAIIGGKSTGKSILLRHIVKGIDPKQLNDKEIAPDQEIEKLDAEVSVTWRDGGTGNRKIIYIPQSWLNRVVDKSGSNTKLNRMIEEILLQQPEILAEYNLLQNKVKEILKEVKQSITEYVICMDEAKSCEDKLAAFGRSDAYALSIDKMIKEREKFSGEAGITEDDLRKYEELENMIGEQAANLGKIVKEEEFLTGVGNPTVLVSGCNISGNDEEMSRLLNNVPTIRKILEEALEKLNTEIGTIWQPAVENAYNEIKRIKTEINDELDDLNNRINPLKILIAQNHQLSTIDEELKDELNKLKKAQDLEAIKDNKLKRAEELKEIILSSRNKIYLEYRDYSNKLKSLNSSETNLVFEAQIEYKKRELFEAISSLFDNRNLKTISDNEHSFSDIDKFQIDDQLFEIIWDAIISGKLSYKGGNDLLSVLERLFVDWFYVHYKVTSGSDSINSMSPGKKALVLLELIINLEKGNCPILIDQPEDDLDNRSIYMELVNYIKKKKHERQIIVVTHNANVVIGADAEEVIIANQHGKETENNSKQFEYRSGAIENISCVYDENGNVKKGILNQKGIQDQICDVLEGGKDAFDKRRNKYASVRR